ncbi:hypothetical protein [Alteromonas sp. 009811495]|uniref:hypothetical protein n=1 Tax=Alteromonas sp. 009811495 TaxID=3002962 RepID=UPI00237E592A|nr:hypothetical protein [Alteromonas sp. 009811495]WDT87258.1 hypothetical protein OZ660_05735 [Alteromonas sp. 009811495]
MMIKTTGTILISVLGSFSALANNLPTRPDTQVEVIEVTTSKPLTLLREQYEAATFAVFDTFNTLVGDSDLHYVCEKKKRPNSRLTYTVCQDAFEIRIRNTLFKQKMVSNRSNSFMERASLAQASAEMGTAEIGELEKLKATLVYELAQKNSVFKEALVNLNAAKRKYEEAHVATYGELSSFASENEPSEK